MYNNFKSDNLQAKVRSLTQDMGRSVLELTTCSTFLGFSLLGRIAPR